MTLTPSPGIDHCTGNQRDAGVGESTQRRPTRWHHHFVCLSSSITHESPVYLVSNGDMQPFLSLCGKKQLLCRLKMGKSSNLLWRLYFNVIATVHTALNAFSIGCTVRIK